VLAGLILAYIFLPVYKLLLRVIRNKTISAAIVSLFLLVLIIVPLWFVLPIASKQVFEIFRISQDLEIRPLVKTLFPAASEQFVNQVELAVKSSFSKLTAAILNSTVDILVNFFIIALHILLGIFVFFFTLKDSEKLKEFASGILPLAKSQEKKFIEQFKDITQSLLYGQIVAGVIQGLTAAIALYLFGIPNALVLSVIAIILSIIPVIGPSFLYVPVTIFMALTGNPLHAVGYLLFNIVIVSSIDNIFRANFVSRRTNLSQAVVMIGMIGGLFMFNVLGLIIGPLILAYLITLLRAYKEKNLSSFFDSS